MEKEQVIEEIKKIIAEVGSFGIDEVEADCSPCVGSLGKYVGLAEGFNLDSVEVSVYMPSGFSSDAEDEYTTTYEELDKDVLEEILALCEQYKESQE